MMKWEWLSDFSLMMSLALNRRYKTSLCHKTKRNEMQTCRFSDQSHLILLSSIACSITLITSQFSHRKWHINLTQRANQITAISILKLVARKVENTSHRESKALRPQATHIEVRKVLGRIKGCDVNLVMWVKDVVVKSKTKGRS